ncbi:hypothetical protein [Paenibacillus hexagrammi]|uniref:Uncharacterized protein n=1 Tax=Paenibacillus hexagrammi TaxID=2908839 RepID=A0ABY3SGP6_9BACL|nr:hypothetical protein [Paenibacillus sp. YPD9-1]UJF32371.1 hypothetical protein L0M14_22100 [Paenibacillus sp. YPD9-1]
MALSFFIEPAAYTPFDQESELLEQCKEWGLLSDKATKSKAFFYKGSGSNLTCQIVGYVDKITAVIEFEDKRLHCIHPSYLKEMQAASYGQKAAASTEEPAGEKSAANSTSAKAATESESLLQEESSVIQAEQTALGQEQDQAQAVAAVAETITEIQPERAEAAPPKAKKGKAPKLELPEDKVKMTATVQEFTTVPNNFSDNDDEVIIYEAAAILDPALEIGAAWSSNSATMKKLELNIGDTITFEAKVVAKKLTKHPVPYKINNPSKIQKV